MKFIDDLIVAAALRCLRGAMVIGTGLAYLQALALAGLAAMLGTLSFSVAVVVVRHAFF